MPSYGVAQAGSNFTQTAGQLGPTYVLNQGLNLTEVCPGEQFKCFDAESVAAITYSVAFARGPNPGLDYQPTTFQIICGASPTAVVVIQGSNVDVNADYETLWTSTNTQFDNFTDTNGWKYYRAGVTSGSVASLTVVAQR